MRIVHQTTMYFSAFNGSQYLTSAQENTVLAYLKPHKIFSPDFFLRECSVIIVIRDNQALKYTHLNIGTTKKLANNTNNHMQ